MAALEVEGDVPVQPVYHVQSLNHRRTWAPSGGRQVLTMYLRKSTGFLVRMLRRTKLARDCFT